MCIKTVAGIFSLSIWSKDIMMSFAKLGSYSNFSSVVGEWRILASKAEEKSKEKMWISVCFDFSSSLRIQLIMSCSTIFSIVSSFTLIFWRIAMQNHWVTLPSSYSFKMAITSSQILIPFSIKYVTPWGVDAITEIKAQIACLSPWLLILSKSSTNPLFPCFVIKNMSFQINSATNDLHYSGEICNAFTLNESNTSMMFSTLFSSLALINFILCSVMIASENNSDFSFLISESKILWYFPSWIL